MTPHEVRDLIARAEAIARVAHVGQVDKQGAVYIDHPATVHRTVTLLGGSPEQRAAAWLHDTLEDTHVTYDHLVDAVGKPTADIVAALTRPADVTYLGWVTSLVGTPAALVKLADLLHNTDTSRGPIPDGLYGRYRRALAILTGGLLP